MCSACEHEKKVQAVMALTCHGPVGVDVGYTFARRVVQDQRLRTALERCRDAKVPVSLEYSSEISRQPDTQGVSMGSNCPTSTITTFVAGLFAERTAA